MKQYFEKDEASRAEDKGDQTTLNTSNVEKKIKAKETEFEAIMSKLAEEKAAR